MSEKGEKVDFQHYRFSIICLSKANDTIIGFLSRFKRLSANLLNSVEKSLRTIDSRKTRYIEQAVSCCLRLRLELVVPLDNHL